MLGMVEKIAKRPRRGKPYGFISGYDGEKYWFSLIGVENINVGDEVSFKGRSNEKGFSAYDVKAIH